MRRTIVCQKWEESELGWGTRPDGCSLHLTEKQRGAYIKEYWARMPNEAPEEYSRPYGAPYLCEVSEEVYQEIKRSKNGIHFYGETPKRV